MKSIDLVQGEIGLELPHEQGNWVLKQALGYSPVQLLVSAIGGCGGYVYQNIVEKSKIDFVLNRIHIDYEENLEEKSHPLKHVIIEFYGRAPETEQDKAQRALRLVNEYCPVIQSLDPGIVVEKKLIFE